MHKWIVAGGLAAVIVAASACQKVDGYRVPRDGDLSRVPECPHEWPKVFGGVANPKGERAAPLPAEISSSALAWLTAGLSNESSVARQRTNVPEYHDCQRMRKQDAGSPVSYGALAAIFAADSLERPADSAIVAARVIGEVLSDGEYAPLHFKKDFSCLVIAPDKRGLKAWMVPVGVDEQRCGSIASLQPPSNDDLLTVQVVPGKFSGNDIPPVARWDWDEKNHVQYIGIRCGNQWCEIGPKGGFTTSASYGGEITTAVKGYYDEQRLGTRPTPFTNGADAPKLVPSENVGTVAPATDLKQKDVSEFNKKWTAVAQVWMRPEVGRYDYKYNFTASIAPGEVGPHATLELCRGSWWECPGMLFMPSSCTPDAAAVAANDWWARFWKPKIFARITSPRAAGGSSKKYLCVIRRTGMGDPPAVARWRWRASDETIWVRCAQGCCEVDANFF